MSQEPALSKIDVNRDSEIMVLNWKDGLRQKVTLADLRRLCPCAVCEGNRLQHQEGELHMITNDELQATAGLREVVPVGRYAIQIRWADGHDTGIYTYSYLRSLGTVASE